MNARWLTMLATALALVAVVSPAVTAIAPRLLYNPSASAPRGWYAVRPAPSIRAGDLLLAALPPAASEFAAARGYLPRGLPVIKRAAAKAGDCVCALGSALSINGTRVVTALAADGAGRELRAWIGCRMLTADEVFLLGDGSLASFDSRYFGPVSRAAVLGVVVPLWTW